MSRPSSHAALILATVACSACSDVEIVDAPEVVVVREFDGGRCLISPSQHPSWVPGTVHPECGGPTVVADVDVIELWARPSGGTFRAPSAPKVTWRIEREGFAGATTGEISMNPIGTPDEATYAGRLAVPSEAPGNLTFDVDWGTLSAVGVPTTDDEVQRAIPISASTARLRWRPTSTSSDADSSPADGSAPADGESSPDSEGSGSGSKSIGSPQELTCSSEQSGTIRVTPGQNGGLLEFCHHVPQFRPDSVTVIQQNGAAALGEPVTLSLRPIPISEPEFCSGGIGGGAPIELTLGAGVDRLAVAAGSVRCVIVVEEVD